MAYNKNKLYKTLDYWSRDMLNFSFSEKSVGLVSQSHLVYDLSGKKIFMLHSIKFHCHVAFTSRDIEQYVYYDCLLTRL